MTEEGAAETNNLKNNRTEDKEEDLMDTHDEGTHNGGKQLVFFWF